MALGSTVKMATRRIAGALEAFAAQERWDASDYRILFHINRRWGRIGVFFVVKDFGGLSRQEMWARVFDHLEQWLKTGPDIGYSVGLSVRNHDEVNQGGADSIPLGYMDYKDILATPSVTD
jgi:hypothetical protein